MATKRICDICHNEIGEKEKYFTIRVTPYEWDDEEEWTEPEDCIVNLDVCVKCIHEVMISSLDEHKKAEY